MKEKTGLAYMMHESSWYRQPCMAARELYKHLDGKVGLMVGSLSMQAEATKLARRLGMRRPPRVWLAEYIGRSFGWDRLAQHAYA